MRSDFAVLGTGPGGCAAAVLLDALGHSVTMYGRRPERRLDVEAAGGLTLREGDTDTVARGLWFTEDIGTAIAGVRKVLLAVPTSALPDFARLMAPHLSPDAVVLLAPGHTGGALAFVHALAEVDPELADRVTIAETFTLPFVARMTGPAEVTVWRRMSHLLVGARPISAMDTVLDAFAQIFPSLEPVESVMVSSLSNINAVLHPPGMLGNIGWIESTSGDFRFYSEGVTPGIGALMAALDRERLAVAAAYEIDVDPFLDLFHRAGLTDDASHASGDVYTAVHNSEPNTLIRSPRDLTDRYVVEDVGCGLVAIHALAAAAGIRTPVTDGFIHMASVVNGVDYFRDGLNASRLGIDGLDRDAVLRHARG